MVRNKFNEPSQMDKQMLDDLIELALKLNIKVRIERGNFRSGYCEKHDERMIIVNSRLQVPERLVFIGKVLMDFELEDVWIIPRVREFLESLSADTN
jgi:hypothetical protein